MNLRHLRYFVALAREGNHQRAATACHVTQPTLSEAIRHLERELAVPLLNRNGQRFAGLTVQGERVLAWARRILSDEDALTQELADIRGGLSGELRFGIIPAAIPMAPLIINPFCRTYPQVTLRIVSCTSIEIQRGFDEGSMAAGMTYLDNEPLHHVRTLPLYRERYMLLTPLGGPFDGRRSVTWAEAAEMPLCLLSRDMQNRRIIDRLFADGGASAPRVAIETNSVLALLAHVGSGQWSSVIPQTYLGLLGHGDGALAGITTVPLVAPEASHTVGLVFHEREPLPPLARALMKSAQSIDIAAALKAADTPT